MFEERRSIRKFRQDEVPREFIERIIAAGITAPSAKNRQPWKCIVFGGSSKDEFVDCMERGIFREENGASAIPASAFGIPDAKNTVRIMREAPVVIAVLNTNGESPFLPIDADGRFTEICDSLSIGAFIENMILQAQLLGLGTLWIANTCFAYEELMSYLKADGQLIGAVAVGYADENPPARPRKSIDETVEFRLK